MLNFIQIVSLIFLKIVALLCPLVCIAVLIKEEFKTIPERILVVFLVVIFGIFLYLF